MVGMNDTRKYSKGHAAWWARWRSSWLSLLLGVTLLLGIGGWFWWRRHQAPLVVEPKYLSLGEVWEDASMIWTLPVRNRTNRAIRLSGFATSCACVRVEPEEVVVPAGGEVSVRLVLNLLPWPGKGESGDRTFEVKVRPRFADAKESWPLEWVLRGRVKRVFEVEPGEVCWGEVSVLAQPLERRHVRVRSKVALSDLLAWSATGNEEIQARLVGPQVWEVAVRPRGVLPRGPFQGSLWLQGVLPDGERVPAREVALSGEVVGDVAVSPPLVLWGAGQVGDERVQEVTLHSRTGRRLEVLGVQTKGAGLRVSLWEKKGESVRSKVRQWLLGVGEQHGQVVWQVRVEGSGVEEVVVPVSYWGMQDVTATEGRASH
jgi:hypothetical protein